MSIFIEKNHLFEIFHQLADGHVKYAVGEDKKTGKLLGKAALNATPQSIKELDCSGFVRYLIYQATDGKTKMSDGSYYQRKWCEDRKLTVQDYAKTAYRVDGKLRIAFLSPNKPQRPYGHVWLLYGGKTLESYSSGKGPGSRPWNTTILANNANACFILANVYSMTMGPVTVTSY